jgi:putative oxidoreductase
MRLGPHAKFDREGTTLESADFVLLIVRIWLGAVMIAHGINHGRNFKGTASYFESKGFRQADLLARVSTYGEIGVGLGLALGAITPIPAAGLIATMTLAFGSVHRFAGFFVFKRPDEGWEYVATLSIAALAVATLGPGAVSVDAALGIDLSGWWGLLIALAGVVLGAVQLAALWRKPKPK